MLNGEGKGIVFTACKILTFNHVGENETCNEKKKKKTNNERVRHVCSLHRAIVHSFPLLWLVWAKPRVVQLTDDGADRRRCMHVVVGI